MTLPAKTFLSIGDCIAALRDEINSVIFVDGSYYTAKNRNGQSEFKSRPRIAGARFFGRMREWKHMFEIREAKSKRGGGG